MTASDTVQQQTGEERIDYNALDNTTGGRALQASYLAVALAVPDYVTSVPARIAAFTGVTLAAVGTIAAFNAFDEDPRNDLTARIDDPSTPDTGSPVRTWSVLAIGAATFAAGVGVHVATQTKAARYLRKQGVSHPHTAIGLGAGLGMFVFTEARALLSH